MEFGAKIEFPCGMKYEVLFRGSALGLGFGKMESKLEDTICPLHGKECKRR